MIKLINAAYGNVMYVSEARLDEYLAAGHRLADEEVKEAVTKTAAKPKQTKRRTTRKKAEA